jgi:hypothetical protein
MISALKFYKLFLQEINKRNRFPSWNNNEKWTKLFLKGKDCVMTKIADRLGFLYCNEYFSLDGIFYRKKLAYRNLGYAQNIEVIIEHENDIGTIETEIYKLFPLFLAPLKVIITYVDSDKGKDVRKIKKIKDIIKERIKNDDIFSLHKNKIETLLIAGFKKGNKICWQGFF